MMKSAIQMEKIEQIYIFLYLKVYFVVNLDIQPLMEYQAFTIEDYFTLIQMGNYKHYPLQPKMHY